MTLGLLHGFAGLPTSWTMVVGEGPDHVPLLLPGHGPLSGCEPEALPRSFDATVDMLAAALPEGAWLAGYSLGGRLALGLLARHPGRFIGATVVGAHPGLSHPVERAARREWDEGWARRIEVEGLAHFVAAWERLQAFSTQSPAQRRAQRATRMAHESRGLAWAMRVLGLGSMPDLLPALARVRRPVQALVGELDIRLSPLWSALAHEHPWLCVTRVPGAGHNLLIEAPAAVVSALRTRGRGLPPWAPSPLSRQQATEEEGAPP